MRKSIVIIIHVSYWICYAILLAFFIYLLGLSQRGSLNHVEYYLKLIYFVVFPAFALFYLSYFILFEKYLKKRKILALCISIILGAYLATSLGGLLLKISLGYNILFDEGFIISIPLTFIVSSIPLVHGVFGIGMRAFISWFDEVKLREDLSKKNFETELALVKYIELQKIRTSNDKFVDFKISGNYDSIMIEPMLFIPFIENAFKYAENLEDENAIKIKFSFEKNEIIFRCENKYDSSDIASSNGGLGNELIKKRLSLLFPKNHALIIDNSKGTYSVILTISQ